MPEKTLKWKWKKKKYYKNHMGKRIRCTMLCNVSAVKAKVVVLMPFTDYYRNSSNTLFIWNTCTWAYISIPNSISIFEFLNFNWNNLPTAKKTFIFNFQSNFKQLLAINIGLIFKLPMVGWGGRLLRKSLMIIEYFKKILLNFLPTT